MGKRWDGGTTIKSTFSWALMLKQLVSSFTGWYDIGWGFRVCTCSCVCVCAEQANIIRLLNWSRHGDGMWGEQVEVGSHPAEPVAVLHSTQAAQLMDWCQLERGSPESIRASSWNWTELKPCGGALPFCMGNLIKPVLTFKPRDVMANNGLELHYFVVTPKICVSQVTLSTHCELPALYWNSVDLDWTPIHLLAH